MSTELPKRAPAAHETFEDEFSLLIRIIACGHGDTILVRLPGPKWVLIDCNLEVKEDRDRFFRIVTEYGVRCLDLLVLTHPHYDHYAGMADVVSYFTREGRRIGAYCDSGINFVHILKLMEAKGLPGRHVNEYAKFINALSQHLNDRTIDRHRLDDNHRSPIRMVRSDGHVQLHPIAPRESFVLNTADRALAGEKLTFSPNALSVVMVLQLNSSGRTCQVLFSADAEAQSLKRAVSIWERHEENLLRVVCFDAVKVSHHGSRTGHCVEVARAKSRSSIRVAAISVGTEYGLPHVEVVDDYQGHGWDVLATTTTRRAAFRNSLIEQFNRTPTPASSSEQQDILITWNPGIGVHFEPPGAAMKVRKPAGTKT